MEKDLKSIINNMETLCIELEGFEQWGLQKHAARIHQDLRNFLGIFLIEEANRKRSLP
jgi:hypothetical protein